MKIIEFDELDSTNLYVKKNIDTLEDKSIISASVQSNGYGRFERKWVDLGSENIYMTFVLKPSEKILEVYSNLTQYLSVCLCKQLEGFGLKPQIKWPNDVLVNDKKICGILAEAVIKSSKLKGIALGIGINLNASEKSLLEIDRPATSLNIELGENINKQKFIEDLANRFFEGYDAFLKEGFTSIKEDYEKFSLLTSHVSQIKISIFNTIKKGIFKGFDYNGNLIIVSTNGKTENINMGEII